MSDPLSPKKPHNLSPDPVIGILGGMGPAATIDLMRRVMEATPAKDDIDHIHLLVDQNPKVPSRIEALITGAGPSPAQELVRMAKYLEGAGATMLAIACNTAHCYADEITAAVDIPLLNMIALTADAIAKRHLRHRRIGVLASTAVLQLGLYEKALEFFGIVTLHPERQTEVMNIIKAIKAKGVNDSLRWNFNDITQEFLAREVDLLLVACTELSLLVDDLDNDLIVDSLDILVSKIVECASERTGLDTGSKFTA